MSSQCCTLSEAEAAPRQLGIRVRLDGDVGSLGDSDIAVLRNLMARHGVVCLTDQALEPAALQSFVARWGDVIELTGGLAFESQEGGLPSITRVGNIRPDGSIMHDVHFAEYWHHDGDFWQPGQHFVVNFLSSVVVPSVGGQTGFLDTRRAFEALDSAARQKLAGATVCVRASEISDFQAASPDEIPPDAVHQVLQVHPLTGETALYLPESSTGVEGKDGTNLGFAADWIDPLIDRIGMYEHEWEVGDLLIFDNVQSMHRGMGGYGDEPRLLYRCQARLKA